ncbi:CLUMA_CG005630, isoform A [Clunio marinus]|uniref:CLUMA_CG005630, isoform A n=1 Tax=Clunio marinus TaxID=568069 RepID=A0A1J1HWZ9_9DIPT|nr:CLUMA_CG005630, isoform A [Clunio marinus]
MRLSMGERRKKEIFNYVIKIYTYIQWIINNLAVEVTRQLILLRNSFQVKRKSKSITEVSNHFTQHTKTNHTMKKRIVGKICRQRHKKKSRRDFQFPSISRIRCSVRTIILVFYFFYRCVVTNDFYGSRTNVGTSLGITSLEAEMRDRLTKERSLTMSD